MRSSPPQPSRPSHRVAVTGAGIVTGLGGSWIENARGFESGRSAFRPVTLFDVSRHRVKVAAELDLPAALPDSCLSKRQVRRLDRAGRLLLIAAAEAWTQAAWPAGQEFLPVVLGTTSGGMSLGQDFFRQAMATGSCRGQPSRVSHYLAQRQGQDLAEAFGFRGPVVVIANACASGANAIGHASDLIRHGRAERVLCGGYDALNELVFSGFDALQALSPTVCRPFDQHRDGLGLGEGAALFALETFSSARGRGAVILGEIAGYGASTDVHHLTQPHPDGEAPFLAMEQACAQAGVRPEQIGYVNAHGTGTPLNDAAEAAAINRWAGSAVRQIRVSSTKGSVGHLLGAAGAVEAVVCLMALQGQWLPPSPTLTAPDPVAAFPLVREPVRARFDWALTNSLGFGGANASLVLRRSSD